MSVADETPGITYQASLPLSWGEVPQPTLATLIASRHSNIALLRTLAALEASVPERDHELDTHAAKALERLETKLDIALNMLAQLAARDISMPATTPIVLGARQVEWHGNTPQPAQGQYVAITLYLSPRLPQPLRLYSRIVVSENGRCLAKFLDQDAEFDEWMTRTLFRYHRRGLQARHQQ